MTGTDTELEKLHSVELELLRLFIQICEEHAITYFIIGGTLLGAVRHEGFIPWDDDIDIAVPREDYNRLISIMRSLDNDQLGMEYFLDNNEVYYYPIRLVHKQYLIKEARSKNGVANPWIDILPIDGAPNGVIPFQLFKARMSWYRLLLGLHYSNNLRTKKRPWYERAVIRIAQKTGIGAGVNPTKVKLKIDAVLTSNSLNTSALAGTCMGAYFFHEYVPKDYFGNGSTIFFEGLEVRAPEKTDKYLAHIYGEDYIVPPPKEQRHSHGVEFIAL